jgi:EAL domain-containing protein (putative c-di-GMP-specific phosphodiesterase class I)/GGDEF domain-containing protein
MDKSDVISTHEAPAIVGGRVTGFVAIGVDRFPRVRAAIGHDLAELLFACLAERIRVCLPNVQTIRLAPDCIGVRLLFAAAPEHLARLLPGLRTALEQSMDLSGHRIHVGVRLGYALLEADEGAEDAALQHRAELALDQARESGRGVQLFSSTEYGDPRRRLALLDDLRLGIDRQEVSLCYQPIVAARTGVVASVESLMRWTSPTHGVVSPGQFIPIAEETGQICDLTLYAIRQAISDSKELDRNGFPMRIGVNLSSRALIDSKFVEAALDLIEADFDRISFEITETSSIEEWKIALDNLRRFSGAGVKLAIDDYGSGLCSLAYLQQLPAQTLKIDQSFISQLAHSHRDPLLVRSTIELGHALELEVVGEGVEDAETLALLTIMGCDLVQGYFIGRPMELPELLEYLRSDAALKVIRAPLSPNFLFGS